MDVDTLIGAVAAMVVALFSVYYAVYDYLVVVT